MTLLVSVLALVLGVVIWPTRHLSGIEPLPTRELEPATAASVAEALTLLSLAIRSGQAPLRALDDVSRRVDGATALHLARVAAAHRWGLDPHECWSYVPDIWRPAALAWAAADVAGVSPAGLLQHAAETVRDAESRRLEAAHGRAGVLLVLPLGLAFLPGFVLTTVVPVVLALL